MRRLFRRLFRRHRLQTAIAAHHIRPNELVFIVNGRAYSANAKQLVKRP